MALMVLGAVRLRTWARPERARVVARLAEAMSGQARPDMEWLYMEARVVVGQVRFLARARLDRAQGAESPGKPQRCEASLGPAWKALA